MMDFRSDIRTVGDMYASISAGEKFQVIHGEVFVELVERLVELEIAVERLGELATGTRRRGPL